MKLYSPILNSQKRQIWEFSKNIVGGGNIFDRTGHTTTQRTLNTYLGKMGEFVFYQSLLLENLIPTQTYQTLLSDFLKIYEGKENGDNGDFSLNGLSLEIKTITKPQYKRVFIQKDQPPKPYYVCVKLDWLEDEVVGGYVLGVVNREQATQKTFTFNKGAIREAYWCEEGDFNKNELINLLILNK